MRFPAAFALMLLPAAFAQHPVPPTAPSLYAAHISRQVAKVRAETAGHADWSHLRGYQAPDWFRDAKFGIFLHWGVYSVPAFGNEWYSRNMYIPGNAAYAHQLSTYGPVTTHGYKDFIPLFRAEHFNPDAWVTLFQQAGARYIVPVAEHCDGFPMYGSAMTPWNAVRMGPHRDVVGELEHATRAHGLHFGVSSHTAEHWWWYGAARTIPSDVRDSTPETALLYAPAAPSELGPEGVAHPGKQPSPDHLERWLPPDQAWLDNWLARSTELVDRYHPDFFYFDWWIGQPAFQPALQQFAAYYYDRSHQNGIAPVLTYKEESMPADAATLDIERGKLDTLRLLPWQTDTSISIHSWGYVEGDEYRSAESLIAQLVDTVSKNGNLLLNVGPKADGTIPEQARAVLVQIGEWMRINGESIYGTRPFAVFGEGPTAAPKNSTEKNHDIQSYTAQDVRYTTSPGFADAGKRPRTLYATLLGWPVPPAGQTDSTLTLRTLFSGTPYLPARVCSVDLLGSGTRVRFQQSESGLTVTLPGVLPPELPAHTAYVLRIHPCG